MKSNIKSIKELSLELVPPARPVRRALIAIMYLKTHIQY